MLIRRAAGSPRCLGCVASSSWGPFQAKGQESWRAVIRLGEHGRRPHLYDRLERRRRDVSHLRTLSVMVVRPGVVVTRAAVFAMLIGAIRIQAVIVRSACELGYRRWMVNRQPVLNIVDHRLRPLHGDNCAKGHQHDDQRIPHGH